MAITQLILQNFFAFIAIISFIVFIHEFGHFFVARLCGVKIEVFSIGFGKEIFGFNDKKGTRWKLSLIPLGGYVKMYGDKNAASVPNLQEMAKMSEEEKAKSFVFKNVYQRFAIVAAGPIMNFILTILILTFLLKLNGLNTIIPRVDEVMNESAAFDVGLQKGDKILQINDKKIENFNDVRQIVSTNADKKLNFKIERETKIFEVEITPKYQISTDIFGDKVKMGMLGITASEVIHQDLNLAQAFIQSNVETYEMTKAIFKAVGELLTNKRSIDELGGPIKIAKYSGKTVEMGASFILWFIAMISLNLGVMNLLPIPALDGGHLFYYLVEMIRGKALSQKSQMIGFQIGMSLILTLMIFTTYNDLRQIFGN